MSGFISQFASPLSLALVPNFKLLWPNFTCLYPIWTLLVETVKVWVCVGKKVMEKLKLGLVSEAVRGFTWIKKITWGLSYPSLFVRAVFIILCHCVKIWGFVGSYPYTWLAHNFGQCSIFFNNSYFSGQFKKKKNFIHIINCFDVKVIFSL